MNQSEDWYYMHSGVRYGPIVAESMIKLAKNGRINEKTMVWMPDLVDWTPLRHTSIWPQCASNATIASNKKGIVRNVQELISGISGLPMIQGFKLGKLFEGVFRWRESGDFDSAFDVGGPRTTPSLSQVEAAWPKPVIFGRILLIGLLTTLGLALGCDYFENPKILPGFLIIGSFAVPFSVLIFVFEINILRNVTLARTLLLMIGGGVISLILALILFRLEGDILNTEKLLGPFSAVIAGPIEELAKLLAVLIMVGSLRKRFPWTLNGILFGTAIGAGFAGFETAGYVMQAIFANGSLADGYSVMLQRGIFSPFMHVVWTASVVGAYWRARGSNDKDSILSPFSCPSFLRIFALVIAFHSLWNSSIQFLLLRAASGVAASKIPGAADLTMKYGIPILLSVWAFFLVGSWYLMLMLVQDGIYQVRDAQASVDVNPSLQPSPTETGADPSTFPQTK